MEVLHIGTKKPSTLLLKFLGVGNVFEFGYDLKKSN